MKINHESLPSRCSICHQTDKYNPVMDHCLRCNSIKAINIRLIDKNYLNNAATIDRQERSLLLRANEIVSYYEDLQKAKYKQSQQNLDRLMVCLFTMLSIVLTIIYYIHVNKSLK